MGGGTKTYALLTDERGNVLGKGVSGNGNHQIDRSLAAQSIREAAEGALSEAGLRKASCRMPTSGSPGRTAKRITASCIRLYRTSALPGTIPLIAIR
ncbi:hypothetical protein VQ056_06330 [Paenibacillus sp. JTLBN-2024]